MNKAKSYNFSASGTGALRTLEHTFTSKSTFLKEVAQNAYRAGASSIHFNYYPEHQALLIEDDGCGFNEQGWENFFTIYESGWENEKMIEDQKPFGIGAVSMVFASDEVCISSRGKRVIFNSSSLLSGQSIEQDNDDHIDGTLIGLRLKNNTWFNAVGEPNRDFLDLFLGFTLPVYVNGNAIARPCALDNINSIPTAHGHIWLNALKEDGKNQNARDYEREYITFYLQGFRLSESHRSHRSGSTAIIHLDSSQFIARVPDRSCLVDGEEQLKIVKALVMDMRVSQCEELIKSDGLDFFVENYWFTGLHHAPHLLESAPFPGRLLNQYEHLHYRLEEHEYNQELLAGNDETKLIREESCVPCVMIRCESFDERENYEEDNAEFNSASYAFFAGIPTIDQSCFPTGHWIFNRVISDAEEEKEFAISLNGETKHFHVSSTGFWGQKAVLCESFTFHWDAITHPVTVKDSCFYFDGVLIIPSEANEFGDIVRVICGLSNGDDCFTVDEVYMNNIVDDLTTTILLQRQENPCQLIEKIFFDNKEILVGASSLFNNKTFHIHFDPRQHVAKPIISSQSSTRKIRKNSEKSQRGRRFKAAA